MHVDNYAHKYPYEMTEEELKHAIERYESIWRWCESHKFTKAQGSAAQTLHQLKKEKYTRRKVC